MKKSLACTVGLLVAIGIAGGAQAQVTVTPTAPGYTGSFTDLFDVSRGSVVISQTPTVVSNSGQAFPAMNAIGGTGSFSDQTIFQDGSDAIQSFTFKTSSPVTIGGVNLLLAEDGPGITRGFQTVSLFSSNDGVTYSQLFSEALGSDPYSTSYGSNGITVNAMFAPTSAQYFRFDGTPFSTTASSSNGGRVIELDAIPGTIAAAVPEPASWAMMIVGFGMIGAGLRYRQRRTVLRYV